MQAHEFKAKSVDEAIEEGLAALNVTRNDVDIDVINKGSRGLFGIGSEPAVVRISLRAPAPAEQSPAIDNVADHAPAIAESTVVEPATRPEPIYAPVAVPESSKDVTSRAIEGDATTDSPTEHQADADDESDIEDDLYGKEGDEEHELAALAADLLDEMIHLMGFDAQIVATWRDDEDEEDSDEREDGDTEEYARDRYLLLDVEGTDLGALIGRRGETLDHIQYLLRLMVNQQIHQWKNIVIDVEHYKERRIAQVTQLAERMAEQVARTGKAISLEPMPANERRIVHMVLRNHPEVYTESYGEGARRKVHIFAADE